MSTMKILFSLFFALTIPAYALPKVGDSATYSVDDEEGGTTKSGIVTMTLMKIEAGAEKPYVFRVTTQVGGQQKIVTDARAEDLVTRARCQTRPCGPAFVARQ